MSAEGTGQQHEVQGALFDVPETTLPEGVGLPRPGRLRRRGDHLPAAGLLGPHRAGGALDPARDRVGDAAPLQLPRHPRAQGRQAPARHRGLAAEHPHRRDAPARPRRGGPGHADPDERRGQRLRVHQRGRGHRPGARWSGGLRHRGRQGVARGGGHAVGAAGRAWHRAWPPRPTTSSRSVGASARPADRPGALRRPTASARPRDYRGRVQTPPGRR